MTKYALITDFDGTVTTLDIGNILCLHYGATTPSRIEQAFAAKEDAKHWMQSHFGAINASKADFEKVILSYAVLKNGFVELAQYCREKQIPFEIASGGLDIYINPVLKHNNVPPIEIYCVQGTFTADGIAVAFPHFPDKTLEAFKAERIKYYKNQGYTTIFFGDGPSDFDAAKEADILFATSRLKTLCEENNVPYQPFEDYLAALKIIRGEYVSVPA